MSACAIRRRPRRRIRAEAKVSPAPCGALAWVRVVEELGRTVDALESAHVLDLIRLLHEAYRLLDARGPLRAASPLRRNLPSLRSAPPREVALDDAPDVLLRAVALQRREDDMQNVLAGRGCHSTRTGWPMRRGL